MIGEARLNLFELMEDVALTKKPFCLNKVYYESYLKHKGVELQFRDDNSFLLNLYGSDFNPKTKKLEVTGKVRIGIDIYPKD